MRYRTVKRGLDMIASALALLALSPLFIIVILLVRWSSPGPALFMQTRVGTGGKPFSIFKFRSMVQDAPSLGSWQTAEDDPRITRVGKFLRSSSIDELPQLINVLKGDMSLIGPRPATPQQEMLYSPDDWKKRHSVRPGITGLAQVNGRSAIGLTEQTGYDIAYIERLNFKEDISIVIKTLSGLIRPQGVN